MLCSLPVVEYGKAALWTNHNGKKIKQYKMHADIVHIPMWYTQNAFSTKKIKSKGAIRLIASIT